uniref:NADP-dependent oxidoreductase domain-containing protein n=1 Tax=Timema bartmani TaxID=61472 RepID=A0A7R9EP02_9NEOP|nr:unnamed protein product [Timema bartmani]
MRMSYRSRSKQAASLTFVDLLNPRPVFASSRPIIRLWRQQACLDLLHSDVTRRRKGRITSFTAARHSVLFFSGRRACDGPACVGVRYISRQCTRICVDGEWKIYLGETTFNAFERDSNLSPPVIGSIVYHESSALDYAATKAGYVEFCRAPIASLDCMEEFQSTNEHLTQGAPTKEQLLQGLAQQTPVSVTNNSLAPRQSSITPGLRYRNLGKSGLRVSNVGLGTWVTFGNGTSSEEQAEEVINLAYDSGINLFDLSEAYSGPRAEIELGRILQRQGWKRSSYVVTTKIYWNTKKNRPEYTQNAISEIRAWDLLVAGKPRQDETDALVRALSEERGLSRKHVIESVRASLARLQLGYVDVVIIHKADAMCPMEEVVRAMNHVINQGWAMYWGTARWTPVEVMEAYTNCRQFNCVTPICEQTEYHMFCREKTELYMPELYNKIGVGLMTWSPLTMGLVSGKLEDGGMPLFARASFKNKYSSFSWTEDETQAANKEGYTWIKERLQPEETRRQQDKLKDIAQLSEKLGCTVSQLAIAWCLKNESVQCLLLGAATVEQLYESIQSLQVTTRPSGSMTQGLQLVPKLNTTTMTELERILDNKPTRPPMVSTLALR